MSIETRGEQSQPERIDAEITPETENFILRKILVISGPSYTGKDIVAEILHDKHGWPIEDGREMFERRTGVETGHMRRDPSLHRRFDGLQAKFFRRATPDHACIWQTRLGGIILAEERDRRAKDIQKVQWANQRGADIPKLGVIPAVSVLLWARKDVRVERAYQVALRKWELDITDQPEGSELPIKPTKTDIESRLDARAKGDVLDWMPLHPKYLKHKRDPFDRKLSRENGGPVYDIFIDTSDLTPEQVAEAIVRESMSLGAIENPNKESSIPSFEANSNSQSLGEPFSARPN